MWSPKAGLRARDREGAIRQDLKDAPPRLRFARLVCGLVQPFGAGMLRRFLYPYERGKRDDCGFAIRSKTGSMFIGSTGDFHAYPFAVSGYGEWRNLAVALALCAPGDLIVEVGANVGTETVGFSDIVGGDGRVVAFEPLPANLAALRGVIGGLRQDNVALLPYALSAHDGTVMFAVPPASMSQGVGHLLGPDERATGATTYNDRPVDMTVIDVECRMLDGFADELRGMRLLVADAEGSEVSILRGGRRVLRAEQPALVLEASQRHQHRAGLGLEDLHDELSDLGYAAYVMEGLTVEEVVDPRSAVAHSNWLCVPRGRLDLVRSVRRSLRRCALTPFVLGLNPLTSPSRR